jgi:hypothetical protein
MQEINSGAFSRSPTFGMTSFTTIFSDFTNIASAKTHFFRRAFAKQLCRRAFAITFGIYTNLASANHLCRRVFANSHGEPG